MDFGIPAFDMPHSGRRKVEQIPAMHAQAQRDLAIGKLLAADEARVRELLAYNAQRFVK